MHLNQDVWQQHIFHQFRPLVTKKTSLLALLLSLANQPLPHPGLGLELTAVGAVPDAQGLAAMPGIAHACLPPGRALDRSAMEGCDPHMPLTSPRPALPPPFFHTENSYVKCCVVSVSNFFQRDHCVGGIPKSTVRFNIH